METNIIYNENCLDTFSKLDDNSVDIVFTSPPYNRKRNDKYEFYNDQIVDYFGFLKEVIQQSIRVSKSNVYFNIMKNYYNKSDVFKLIGEFADNIYDIFIWEKSNPLPSSGKAITNAYEFIFVFGDSLKSNNTYTKNHLKTSVARMNKQHKAMMHPDVVKFFLDNFTSEGDIVYDPFMGCGTTAYVAYEMKRKYIGSEIIKEYCDISNDRIKSIKKQTSLF